MGTYRMSLVPYRLMNHHDTLMNDIWITTPIVHVKLRERGFVNERPTLRRSTCSPRVLTLRIRGLKLPNSCERSFMY